MYEFSVTVELPEMPAVKAFHNTTVVAGSSSTAIARGLRTVMARDEVKKRRIKVTKVTCVRVRKVGGDANEDGSDS